MPGVISIIDQRQQQLSRFVSLSGAMESEFGVREECGGQREGRVAFGELRHDGRNRWLNNDEVRLTLRRLRFQFASDDVGDGSRRGINLGHASSVIMRELECGGRTRHTLDAIKSGQAHGDAPRCACRLAR